MAGGVIEGIADVRLVAQVLYLDQLHLQGTLVNQVGRAALWRCAQALGRQFQAHTVVVQGGRRTTGRLKGQLPSPITVSVVDAL